MTVLAELEPKQAFDRLSELDVVDVRAEHEWTGPLGRVPGARRIELAELEGRSGELKSKRPLLLVCRSGVRSHRACEMLASLGVGPVVNLAGGMIAWRRAGLPVEESEPRSLGELADRLDAWVAHAGGHDLAPVREALRLELAGARLREPGWTRARLERVVDLVEKTLRDAGPPRDLEPSLASFRRWLTRV